MATWKKLITSGSQAELQTLFTTGDITGSQNLQLVGSGSFGGDVNSSTYNLGFAGNGWRIDSAGDAEFENLKVRGTFSVYELLVSQLRATNGSVIITNSGKVETIGSINGNDVDVLFDTGSGYGHPFQVNDILLAQRYDSTKSTLIQSFVEVKIVDGTQKATVTVLGGSDFPNSGYDYVRIGSTTDADRQGHIYLTADDTNAPYIGLRDGVDAYTDFTSNTGSIEKVRLGKLDGVSSTLFGPLSGYGLWASGSVFLEGGINATTGSIGGVSIESGKIYTGTGTWGNDNTGFYLDSFGSMSLNDTFTWDTENLSISGSSVDINVENFVAKGDSVEISGSNFHLLNGNITASNVDLSGKITATLGKIGGFEITENAITGSNFYLSGSATGNDFFISASNFNVKANGDVTASNADIKGNIVADTGILFDLDVSGSLIMGDEGIIKNQSEGYFISSSGIFLTSVGGKTILPDSKLNFQTRPTEGSPYTQSAEIFVDEPNFLDKYNPSGVGLSLEINTYNNRNIVLDSDKNIYLVSNENVNINDGLISLQTISGDSADIYKFQSPIGSNNAQIETGSTFVIQAGDGGSIEADSGITASGAPGGDLIFRAGNGGTGREGQGIGGAIIETGPEPSGSIYLYGSSVNIETDLAITGNQTLSGDLTVAGRVTAEEFHTEFVSASIIYQSGSTKFGDTSDDKHSFTGSVEVQGNVTASNLSLSGNADISGNITLGGNITIGDADTDNISLNGEINSDLIPDADLTYNIGSSSKAWNQLYAGSITVTSITGSDGAAGSITIKAADTDNGYISLAGTVISYNDIQLAGDGTSIVKASGALNTSVELDSFGLTDGSSTFTGSFSGDGSGLTGLTSDLSVSADTGTISIDLDTQTFTITGGEGINTSGSAQTLTISGEDASDTNKGIASFNSTNFTVTNGDVTSDDFTITAGSGLTGGGNLTLGGSTTLNVDSGSMLPYYSSSIFGTVSGDITIDSAGVATISNDAVELGTDTTGDYVANLGTLTGLTTTGNSGESATPTLAVDYGSTANTAVQGDTTITIQGTTNEIQIDDTAAQALGGAPSYTIGLPNDVTIGNNLTVTGDLTVNGTTTTVDTTNLTIEDKYILLNSGNSASSSFSGIIFGGSTQSTSSGSAIIWNGTYNGGDGRLGVVNELTSEAVTNPTPNYHVAGVFEGTAEDAATAQADHKGNIRVDAEGEIWIYA